MPITRATDIGLRVLITLASAPDDQTTVADLADAIAVPMRYTGKVVQRLAAEGWVETNRGRGGGIKVSPEGRNATPVDVINAFGEGWPTIDCLNPKCPLLAKGCRLRKMLDDAEAAFMASLGTVTMAQLS